MEKQDYYKVGSKDSIVISNSSLSYINPTQGGSPQSFMNFFEESIEEKESRALRLGRTIHLWAEDKDKFHIGDVDKPSEIMGIIADRVIEEMKFNGRELTRELCSDISLLMNYQSRWTLPTRLEKVYNEVEKYVNEMILVENEHKIYLTKSEKAVIEACIASIERNPLAKELLFMQDTDFSNKVNHKELEVYWEKGDLLFKAKIDDFTIDHDRKAVFVNDLKSMSSGVYQYKNFKYYRTWRQFAFYYKAIIEWALQNSIDLTGYNFSYNIIGIETGLLNQCVVWKIKQEWINRGSVEILELVRRIKWHIQNDEWNFSKEEIDNGMFLEMPYEEED